MKAHAVHTCPLWEDRNGRRRPGMRWVQFSRPNVVGWVHVLEVTIHGQRYMLLLTQPPERR